MFVSVKAKAVDAAAADVTVLEPRRFDERRRPLEPRKVAVEFPELTLVVPVDEWVELVRKVNVALAAANPNEGGQSR
jgi:ABC-type amino acid transport substrate-binding protein